MTETPLVIVGASARAAAQSAIRAGFSPWCVDLFTDRDLAAVASVRRCPIAEYPRGLVTLVRDAPADAPLLLTGAMENHLDVVEQLAAARPLLGGVTVEAMRRSRDPRLWREIGPLDGIRFPRVIMTGENPTPLREAGVRWLSKPIRSAGGHGIRFHEPGQAIPADRYAQEYIPGIPMGAAFVAIKVGQRRVVRPMLISRQIIGDASFGASHFDYVGSIRGADDAMHAGHPLHQLAAAVSADCDLHGLFGIDVIQDQDGRFWPIEINPRYTAGMELAPDMLLRFRPDGVNNPPPTVADSSNNDSAGKAIVFAKVTRRVPDLYEFFTVEQIADVPAIGTVVSARRPVCTVRARAANPESCVRDLRALASALYTRLSS